MSLEEAKLLENLLRGSAAKVQRRLYMKRRTSSGYEADWQLIDNSRIIKFGTINQNSSDVINTKTSNSRVNITLNNKDGFFNEVDRDESFFKNFYAIYKTLVKIEADYQDGDNIFPSEATIFIGYINEDYTSAYPSAKFPISPLDDFFKEQNAEDVFSLNTGSSGIKYSLEMLWQARDATDGSGNEIFKEFIPHDNWRGNRGSSVINAGSLSSEIFAGKSVWKSLQEMAETNAFKFYVNRQGKVVLTPYELDEFYTESFSNSLTSDLWQYFPFNSVTTKTLPGFFDTSTSRIASGGFREFYMNSLGNYLFDDVKFKKGIYGNVTSTANLTLNNATGLDTNKFTFEFWFKPYFDTSNGGISPVNVGIISSTIDEVYTTTTGRLKFGWGTWENNTAGTRTLGISKFDPIENDFISAFVNTTTFDFSANTIHFLAFVHDIDGIEGSKDIFRIYHAPDGGSISVIGRETAGSLWPDNRTGFVGLTTRENGKINFGDGNIDMNLLPFSTYLVIENMKIYNYARVDFSNRDIVDSFARKNKLGFSTGNIQVLQRKTEVSKVYNDLTLIYTTGTLTSWTPPTFGDSSSADLYGRIIEQAL